MPDPDNYDDELVSANPNQRNWRGILIALLVIVIVLALIVTSVILLTPPDEGPRVKGSRIKLQDIVDGHYTPMRVNGTWISAEEFLYQNQWGGISLLNAINLSERVLMSNTTFKTLAPVRFSLSADKKYLLLALNVQKLFRHSQIAQYSVYDIQTSENIPLSHIADDMDWPYLHYAQFTPKGHSLIMVYNYDIFYRLGPRTYESYRVTDDAIPGVIYNGIPDWLYEEEILSAPSAIWMSTDGYLMLFGSFNDSLVEEQKFPWYGTTSSSSNTNLYPEIRSLRYPKPGTQNPVATLRIADLADPKNFRIRDIKPPAVLINEDHYFTSAKWVSMTEVSVVWLNRPQNISVVTICKSPMWICQETHRVSGDGKGWVDVTVAPYFASNGSSYIAISPLRDGAAGLFRHLVHVHISQKRILPLTHGTFEVRQIVYWDEINNFVYFLGTPERHPGYQHLYRVSSLPPKFGVALSIPQCLTCPNQYSNDVVTTTTHNPPKLQTAWDDDWEAEHTVPPPTTQAPKRPKKKSSVQKTPMPACQYHKATFSPGSVGLVIIECLGPGVPSSAIYRIGTGHKVLEPLFFIQNNTRLRDRISQIALPQVKTFPVMISGGYHAQVRLYLPPGLREDEITRYPLILHVYSGPGTQLVTDKWRIDWNTYLAGNKDYIIAQIDGRGSSGQGYRLLHEVYRRLGTVEVSDQLEVTEYLRDNLHFVDKRRVGIWGWSYGGYVSALALANELSLFQCGVSVSPVVSWKLYDSTYTERYLSFPNVTDNYKGYEESELVKHVDQLRDKHYLLVHGTADDNVHFQQTMLLAKSLASNGVLFKQQIYPDEGHSMLGVQRHLYRSMTTFFEDCFRRQVPPEVKAGLGNGGLEDRS
ncbi:inactive dipeptidyl peptidase 10 [Bradysia coprophila]|uniref:inactive dipeptidyl peptidase 10 n=1 Tax=Bradysia coprophila TaxID=38358 RepID=UPI00187DD5FF|nr:inactive dipeptidyl peptidase 10 [Bradysia coprophila]